MKSELTRFILAIDKLKENIRIIDTFIGYPEDSIFSFMMEVYTDIGSHDRIKLVYSFNTIRQIRLYSNKRGKDIVEQKINEYLNDEAKVEDVIKLLESLGWDL